MTWSWLDHISPLRVFNLEIIFHRRSWVPVVLPQESDLVWSCNTAESGTSGNCVSVVFVHFPTTAS
jgi:hypothetical protein